MLPSDQFAQGICRDAKAAELEDLHMLQPVLPFDFHVQNYRRRDFSWTLLPLMNKVGK
jgi:hypothetical protein